jgi:hypothetical protein
LFWKCDVRRRDEKFIPPSAGSLGVYPAIGGTCTEDKNLRDFGGFLFWEMTVHGVTGSLMVYPEEKRWARTVAKDLQ